MSGTTVQPVETLANFMQGYAAACQLLARAGKIGAFVECVVMSAAVIDGSLRIALILNHQIKTRSTALLEHLIYQAPDHRTMSERDVFKLALSEGVIDEALHTTLSSLYDDRNRVVHRYIVSDITTHEALQIGMAFEPVVEQVQQIVVALEAKQLEEGVGMVAPDPHSTPVSRLEEVLNSTSIKHGSEWLSRHIASLSLQPVDNPPSTEH